MANNYVIQDKSGVVDVNNKTFKSTDNAGVHTPHVNVDSIPALPAGGNTIGKVDVNSVAPISTIYTGKTTVATAGTRVVLASSQSLTAGVYIKALPGDGGIGRLFVA